MAKVDSLVDTLTLRSFRIMYVKPLVGQSVSILGSLFIMIKDECHGIIICITAIMAITQVFRAMFCLNGSY